jgi:bile acid-coenzyme A ligase
VRLVNVDHQVEALAQTHPFESAVVAVDTSGAETTVTWLDLNRRSNDVANGLLACKGVAVDQRIVVLLPNDESHMIAVLACWKIDAVVVPLDPSMPQYELQALIDAIDPVAVISADRQADWIPGHVLFAKLERSLGGVLRSSRPPRSALATGGSTGVPKIVIRRRSWFFDPDEWPSESDSAIGFRIGQSQLVAAPLWHGGFGATYHGLMLGHRIVVLSRFTPRVAIDCIEKFQINILRLVPAMMRMLVDPRTGVTKQSVRSVVALHHGTGWCPPEVKEAWIELIGAQRVFESYSSQEQLGFVYIRGDEWLQHRGSVGKPSSGSVRILDEALKPCPAGVLGGVFFETPDDRLPHYLGTPPPLESSEGYVSIGDLGILDEDGYLYIKGRASELINVGGFKVVPSEIEELLMTHPGISEAVVVSHPHAILGSVPHALVVLAGDAHNLKSEEIDIYCRQYLAQHKVPSTYEIVDEIPRRESGKIRKSELLSGR